MNTTLSPVRSHDRERHIIVPTLPASDSRISLTDRASLRLGLWLLLRSTRRVRSSVDRAAHSRRYADQRARERRELAAIREQLPWAVRA